MVANGARRQREAVAWLKGNQGYVFYEWDFDSAGNMISKANRPSHTWLCNWVGEIIFHTIFFVGVDNNKSFQDLKPWRI